MMARSRVRPSERPMARGSVRLFPLDAEGAEEGVDVEDVIEELLVGVFVVVVDVM